MIGSLTVSSRFFYVALINHRRGLACRFAKIKRGGVANFRYKDCERQIQTEAETKLSREARDPNLKACLQEEGIEGDPLFLVCEYIYVLTDEKERVCRVIGAAFYNNDQLAVFKASLEKQTFPSETIMAQLIL